MGKQIRFYMLPGDEVFFFQLLFQNSKIRLIYEKPKLPKVQMVDEEYSIEEVVYHHRSILFESLIWHTAFPLENHIRTIYKQKWDETIQKFINTDECFYLIDKTASPVIEVSPTRIDKDGRMSYGRLWAETSYLKDGMIVRADEDFIRFYDKVARLIRKYFFRIEKVDGYIGPEVLSLYKEGKIKVGYYGDLSITPNIVEGVSW
jgi:hypothetical protein